MPDPDPDLPPPAFFTRPDPAASSAVASDPPSPPPYSYADDAVLLDEPPPEPEGDDSDRRRHLTEWIIVIAGALIVALVIKTYLIQAFFIPSVSMEPTLNVGDRVLVNKLSYDLHDVHRGDLVVFKKPAGASGTIDDLIKRVIGLPGDTLWSQDGRVVVNGRFLNEPYLAEEITTRNLPRTTLGDDEYFVMGDNRGQSQDSRIFGPISGEAIVGRAFVRVWPVTDLDGL